MSYSLCVRGIRDTAKQLGVCFILSGEPHMRDGKNHKQFKQFNQHKRQFRFNHQHSTTCVMFLIMLCSSLVL